jgi:hypothetical protein
MSCSLDGNSGQASQQCAYVDSTAAATLAMDLLAEHDQLRRAPDSLVGRELTDTLRPDTTIRGKYADYVVSVFKRDALGAWIVLRDRFVAIGGGGGVRVTGCGCAEVIGQPTSMDSLLRRRFKGMTRLPAPDSLVAVELARDAMAMNDQFAAGVIDSIMNVVQESLDYEWGLAGMKLLEYDVVDFHRTDVGVLVTLAPRRPGWGLGGVVRVTAQGCAAYWFTSV